MSGVKHMPERWEVAGQYVRTPFVVGLGGGLMIADVGHGVWSAEEHAANARLIAAAPDLLAVAIKSHEPYVGLDEEDIRCLYGADEADLAIALRAAITRATGDRPEKGGAL